MHNIYIRWLKIEDALISCHWRNDPEIWQYTGNKPNKFITPEIEKDWLSEKLTEKNSVRFAIIVDNNYIGNIQITDIIEEETGQYHIFIGEKSFWGRGIGTQATNQIIRFAKEQLKLKKLYLRVNPQNLSAVKLYKNIGFINVNDDILMNLNLSDFKPPTVNVFVMTYNHEQFIAKTLQGILMQKTNFEYYIVVGEDCSSDDTRKIVQAIADNYPGKFKLLLHEQNIGAMANQLAVQRACTGKFVAICEGDDYWTDPYKLQKQVDFLEANKKYSMCFHNCIVINENDHASIRSLQINGQEKSTFYTEDLIKQWFIPTASIVFVNKYFDQPDWFSNIQSGDIALVLLLSLKGPVKYLDEVMSVYRLHPNGLSNTHVGYNKFLSMCYLYQTFNIHTNYKFNDKIIQEIKYEFERHALGYETEKLAETELKKIFASTEYLNSKVSIRQTLVLLLYKFKLDGIYKIIRRSLKG